MGPQQLIDAHGHLDERDGYNNSADDRYVRTTPRLRRVPLIPSPLIPPKDVCEAVQNSEVTEVGNARHVSSGDKPGKASG
jgi:hypothetical protein